MISLQVCDRKSNNLHSVQKNSVQRIKETYLHISLFWQQRLLIKLHALKTQNRTGQVSIKETDHPTSTCIHQFHTYVLEQLNRLCSNSKSKEITVHYHIIIYDYMSIFHDFLNWRHIHSQQLNTHLGCLFLSSFTRHVGVTMVRWGSCHCIKSFTIETYISTW